MQRVFNQWPSFNRTAGQTTLVGLTVLALAACGSGGGTEEPLIAQGRYTTGSGVTPAYTVLVVPAATGTYQAWAVSSTGDKLARLSLSATNAVTGQKFDLSANPPSTESVAGTAALAGSADSATLSLPGLSSGSTVTSLTRTDRLTGTTSISTVAGSWSGGFDAGARSATWSINSSGAISGSSNTGCQYAGTVTARSDAPVFDVSFSQTCPTVPTPTVVNFSGLARRSSGASSTLTVVGVSSDGTQPWVSLFSASAP